MKQTILHNTDRWRVDSYGNGTAYLLTDKSNITSDPCDYELFFQGDDATIFNEQVDAMENIGKSYNQIFQSLWNDYK